LIRKFLPKTSHERESFLKGFVLFFLTMELFLVAISYLLYANGVKELKDRIFLELKNYSYTFEGERFRIDVVPLKDSTKFYELFEGEEGLFILVPVPVSDKDAIKIIYPAESFEKDVLSVAKRVFLLFSIATGVSFFLSGIFSLYAISPLRRALNMIEEVTRDIIHDINTPLMSLKVNLKLLRKRYGDDEDIKRMEIALKQLEDLKENLKPLERKVSLKKERVNLKEIVVSELEVFKAMFPDKRVEESLSDVYKEVDRAVFHRIVANLLSNAFKHSSDGNPIRVVLKESELFIQNPANPPKNIDKVFDRYYRESQRGIGLGLSIVKKLCDELSWKIEVGYEKGLFYVRVTFG
jgi:two-component system OmpR family sensor kinase